MYLIRLPNRIQFDEVRPEVIIIGWIAPDWMPIDLCYLQTMNLLLTVYIMYVHEK